MELQSDILPQWDQSYFSRETWLVLKFFYIDSPGKKESHAMSWHVHAII